MSNIKNIAPYAYLAKRSGNGTIYDLYLLVRVDSRKTVDLDNVQPVKGLGTRIYISYDSSEPSTAPASTQEFKHWEIDSEGTYVDIQIQGDSSEELTNLMAFADADTEPATSTDDQHYFAPYLFIGTEIEMEGEEPHLYFCPSTIVLFGGGVGAQNEGLTFSGSVSEYSLTPSDSGTIVTSPENFAVNQSVRHEISGSIYTFGGTVSDYAALDKPIRKAKTRKHWVLPPAINSKTSTTLNSEELAGANS